MKETMYVCNTYNVITSDIKLDLIMIIIDCRKQEKKYIPAVTYKHDAITRSLRKTIAINTQKLVQMGMTVEEVLERTEV